MAVRSQSIEYVMARKILITVGGLLLLTLLLIWVYLLVFSTPGETAQWFMGGITEPTPINEIGEQDITNQLAVPNTALFQLTTKSVAGYGLITTNSSTATSSDYKLRYAETGTGHVFEINLGTAVETRISGITVGKTVGATFSPAGEAFVLTSEQGNVTESALYLYDTKAEKYTNLPRNSKHFFFTGKGSIYYTIVENGETTAYELDWENVETNILWTIPLTQINVVWTEAGVIINNKVSSELKGGIYTIVAGNLSQIVSPKLGLSMTADRSGQIIWYSYFDNKTKNNIGALIDRSGTTIRESPLPAISEKCFLNASERSVCSMSAFLLSGDSNDINSWYRGETTSDDRLWVETDTDTGVAYEANLAELAGFTLDATAVTPTPNYDAFYFINKINRTLWRYQFEN